MQRWLSLQCELGIYHASLALWIPSELRQWHVCFLSAQLMIFSHLSISISVCHIMTVMRLHKAFTTSIWHRYPYIPYGCWRAWTDNFKTPDGPPSRPCWAQQASLALHHTLQVALPMLIFVKSWSHFVAIMNTMPSRVCIWRKRYLQAWNMLPHFRERARERHRDWHSRPCSKPKLWLDWKQYSTCASTSYMSKVAMCPIATWRHIWCIMITAI